MALLHGSLALLVAVFGQLPAQSPAPQPDALSLFNGRDLEGWESVGGKAENWKVVDGLLVTRGEGGGWLSTIGEYADFELSLEYRLQEGGNSGVFIRSPRQGDPAYTGMEIQVLDDESARYGQLQPFQYCGSVYGVIPAQRGHTRPAGEWNRMEITARGQRITVKLNGATIVDGDLGQHKEAAGDHPGILRASGFIGLQSHSEPVEFREIRVRPL
jgi:hypothetical protein